MATLQLHPSAGILCSTMAGVRVSSWGAIPSAQSSLTSSASPEPECCHSQYVQSRQTVCQGFMSALGGKSMLHQAGTCSQCCYMPNPAHKLEASNRVPMLPCLAMKSCVASVCTWVIETRCTCSCAASLSCNAPCAASPMSGIHKSIPSCT